MHARDCTLNGKLGSFSGCCMLLFLRLLKVHSLKKISVLKISKKVMICYSESISRWKFERTPIYNEIRIGYGALWSNNFLFIYWDGLTNLSLLKSRQKSTRLLWWNCYHRSLKRKKIISFKTFRFFPCKQLRFLQV